MCESSLELIDGSNVQEFLSRTRTLRDNIRAARDRLVAAESRFRETCSIAEQAQADFQSAREAQLDAYSQFMSFVESLIGEKLSPSLAADLYRSLRSSSGEALLDPFDLPF